MADSQTKFDAVAKVKTRIANVKVNGQPRVGAETAKGILDITATAEKLGLSAPRDVDNLLQQGLGEEIAHILEAASASPESAVVLDPSKVEYASLVTQPEKIICIGFNYRHHAEETNTPIPKAPPLFCKFWNALNHHNGVVDLPVDVDYQFDYETELVIVFGRECKNATKENALDFVAGYAVGNDLSARTLQTTTSQFLAGKAADGFAPLGPWLAPRALISDPNNLRLQTRVNGQKRQDWNTNDMIFGCKELIVYVSSIMTIKPGDVLYTGTPQGVILGEKAPPEQRRWLRGGDEVVSEIEGLGALKVQLRGPNSPTNIHGRAGRKTGTIDRLCVLSGGEAHYEDLEQWSPGVNKDKSGRFSNNVYLIKHGDDWMVWDTGVQDDMVNVLGGRVVVHGVRGVVHKTLLSQFEEIGVRPDQVTHIAFSHGHFDHAGNSSYFTKAKWFVQEAEFKAMFGPNHGDYGFIPELYKTMEDNMVVVTGDEYDVFGDGSVIIFSTHGHTPGHQSMLIRLPERGNIVLSGDIAHFRDNLCCKRVPYMNPDKEASKRSMERIENLVEEENAELWINHDWDQSQSIPHAPEWIE